MKNTTRNANRLKGARIIDAEEMWGDADIDPVALVKRDPLDITHEMQEMAEYPELADPLIGLLPERKFSLLKEELQRKAWREQARRRQEKENGA